MLRNKAYENTGSILLWSAGVLLCLSVISSAYMEYREAYIIASGTEEMVRKATVTMAVNNSYNAYTGVREARGNAYGADGEGSWVDIANTVDLKQQLCNLFDFQVSGDKLTNTNRSGVEFVLDIRDIEYLNELSDETTLEFDVRYRLEIPLRFMGEVVTTVPIRQATRATYIKKY